MANYIASVITPAYNRERTIDRCIGSVVNPGMTTSKGAYEHIIINDASEDSTAGHVKEWAKKYPYNITFLNWEKHLERVNAFNAGMLQAQGEWIVHLDSDDELAHHFKQAFEDALDMYPNANVFTWGSIRHWKNKDGRYYRTDHLPAFQVKVGATGAALPFKSGTVASGSFAFKKSCLNVIGYYPLVKDPYSLGKWLIGQHQELEELWRQPDGRIKYDLGNPWGQDYALMYRLTRHWIPQPLNQILNYVHVRP